VGEPTQATPPLIAVIDYCWGLPSRRRGGITKSAWRWRQRPSASG